MKDGDPSVCPLGAGGGGGEGLMSDIEKEGFFVSRRPLVAGERRLIGWELCFGSQDGRTLSAGEKDSAEYLTAVREFAETTDWDALLCGGRALLVVDRRLVFSDVIDAFPRNRMLLGLRPCEEIDANLSNRLHHLHSRRGARLLFLGYARRDPREQLLALADAVEIDAFNLEERARSLLVRRAQRRNLQILAMSVERDADFVRIRESGYELFSGGSYCEHSPDGETGANANGKELVRLLVDTRVDLELEAVSRRIKANPALAEGLLRLVNSLEVARAATIESVDQALIMIGTKGLSRWLNLLLFQMGSRPGIGGPLFRVAASRAALMERLAGSRQDDSDAEQKTRGEAAFLVGILSLVHVLLGVDRSEAISGLSLSDEMRGALAFYDGELGRMLALAESLDAGEFPAASELAQELSISPKQIWEYQRDAFEWVMRML